MFPSVNFEDENTIELNFQNGNLVNDSITGSIFVTLDQQALSNSWQLKKRWLGGAFPMVSPPFDFQDSSRLLFRIGHQQLPKNHFVTRQKFTEIEDNWAWKRYPKE